MKVRALAWITFTSMLRNKFIMLFCAVFLCVILLMMTPLMAMKTTAASQSQGAMMVLGLVSAIMTMLTGFGSLLLGLLLVTLFAIGFGFLAWNAPPAPPVGGPAPAPNVNKPKRF